MVSPGNLLNKEWCAWIGYCWTKTLNQPQHQSHQPSKKMEVIEDSGMWVLIDHEVCFTRATTSSGRSLHQEGLWTPCQLQSQRTCMEAKADIDKG